MSVLAQNEQKLSPHFTLNEFIRSATADVRHINNRAPPDVLKNLKLLAFFCEQVRTELGGVPMIISSGYRSPELNKAVGGVTKSSHLLGLACDFTAPCFGSPYEICQKLANSTLAFDQLILECSVRAKWVHLGIAAKNETPRRQVLTINSKGTRVGLWAS